MTHYPYGEQRGQSMLVPTAVRTSRSAVCRRPVAVALGFLALRRAMFPPEEAVDAR